MARPESIGSVHAVTPDPAALDRLGLLKGRYFLAVGSVHANKNLTALQAAFAALPAGHGCPNPAGMA